MVLGPRERFFMKLLFFTFTLVFSFISYATPTNNSPLIQRAVNLVKAARTVPASAIYSTESQPTPIKGGKRVVVIYSYENEESSVQCSETVDFTENGEGLETITLTQGFCFS